MEIMFKICHTSYCTYGKPWDDDDTTIYRDISFISKIITPLLLRDNILVTPVGRYPMAEVDGV